MKIVKYNRAGMAAYLDGKVGGHGSFLTPDLLPLLITACLDGKVNGHGNFLTPNPLPLPITHDHIQQRLVKG